MTAATLPLARAALSAVHSRPRPAATPARCSGPTPSLSAARTTRAASPPRQTLPAPGSSPASPAANGLPTQRSSPHAPRAPIPALRSRSRRSALPLRCALLQLPTHLPAARAPVAADSQFSRAGSAAFAPASPAPAAPCTPASAPVSSCATPLHLPPLPPLPATPAPIVPSHSHSHSHSHCSPRSALLLLLCVGHRDCRYSFLPNPPLAPLPLDHDRCRYHCQPHCQHGPPAWSSFFAIRPMPSAAHTGCSDPFHAATPPGPLPPQSHSAPAALGSRSLVPRSLLLPCRVTPLLPAGSSASLQAPLPSARPAPLAVRRSSTSQSSPLPPS